MKRVTSKLGSDTKVVGVGFGLSLELSKLPSRSCNTVHRPSLTTVLAYCKGSLLGWKEDEMDQWQPTNNKGVIKGESWIVGPFSLGI